jgi:hypothetical protein
MSTQPLVTVVTPTTCDPSVLRAIQSVADQTYDAIQHLIVIDNPDAPGCPLYPQKRTSLSATRMSALCQKRTLRDSFDYLVGKREERAGILSKILQHTRRCERSEAIHCRRPKLDCFVPALLAMTALLDDSGVEDAVAGADARRGVQREFFARRFEVGGRAHRLLVQHPLKRERIDESTSREARLRIA